MKTKTFVHNLHAAICLLGASAAIFCAPSGRAAINVQDGSPTDFIESGGTGAGGGGTISTNFTVTSGASVLVVELLDRGAGSVGAEPATLAWGSQSLVQAVTEPNTSSTWRDNTIYYLFNPTPGTNSITATDGASSQEMVVFSLNNVDTNVVPLVGAANLAAGTTLSTTVSGVPSGGWAAVICGNNTAGNPIHLTASSGSVMDYQDSTYDSSSTTFGGVSGLSSGIATFILSEQNSEKLAMAAAVFTPAGAPTVLATTGVNHVSLNWSSVVGAVSYNVLSSTTSGGPYTTLISGQAGTSYSDSSAVVGTPYYYVVQALNSDTSVGNSAQVVGIAVSGSGAAPAVPTSVAAAVGNNSAAINWAVVPGATGYIISSSTTSGGPYTVLGLSETNMYTDFTAVNETTYYYVVQSVNANNVSGDSSQAFVTPLPIIANFQAYTFTTGNSNWVDSASGIQASVVGSPLGVSSAVVTSNGGFTFPVINTPWYGLTNWSYAVGFTWTYSSSGGGEYYGDPCPFGYDIGGAGQGDTGIGVGTANGGQLDIGIGTGEAGSIDRTLSDNAGNSPFHYGTNGVVVVVNGIAGTFTVYLNGSQPAGTYNNANGGAGGVISNIVAQTIGHNGGAAFLCGIGLRGDNPTSTYLAGTVRQVQIFSTALSSNQAVALSTTIAQPSAPLGGNPLITLSSTIIGATVTSNATVTLSVPSSVTAGHSETITLTSGNTVVTPNQTIVLPIGVSSTNLSFPILSQGSSTVTAAGNGLVSASLIVNGALPTINLPLAASAGVGQNALANLTLTCPYPFTGPYTIALTSANTVITVSQTVTLGVGVTSTNLTFPILASGLSAVTASGSGLNSASIQVGDTVGILQVGLYNDWVGDDYVSGNNWTDRFSGVVAALDGNGFVPPVSVPGIFGGHNGVQRDPNGGDTGFSIPEFNPPTGYTNYTVVVTLYASVPGPTGANYYQDQGIIGYDIGGAGQADWGISWGGNNNQGSNVVAGIGRNGGDSGTESGPLSMNATHAVALQVGVSSISLYVDGVLQQTDTGLSIHAAGPNSNGTDLIPLLSAIDQNYGGVFTNPIAEVRIYTNAAVNAAALTAYLTNYYPALSINLPVSTGGFEGQNAYALLTIPASATAGGPLTITLTSDLNITGSQTVVLPQGVTSTNLAFPIYAFGQSQVVATAPGLIQATILVNGFSTLVWAGFYNNLWDVNNDANWVASSSPSVPVTYVDGAPLIFDDTFTVNNGSPDVDITQPVAPGSVTFSNNANAYGFNGSAIGGSGGVVLDGSNSVTFSNINTYSGNTVVNNGTLATAGPLGIPAGTVAYWTFANGANLGADSSGNAYTLITGTGTPVFSASGPLGGSLYLNGSSTLNFGGTFPANLPVGASPYTIAVWERADNGDPANGGFVGWGDNTGGEANNLRLDGDGINNYWYANDYAVDGLIPSPMDGNWHAIAVTWDGTTRTLYLDGAAVGSQTPTPPSVNGDNFVVGKTTADVDFKGWLENLLIVNQALTPAQIATFVPNGNLSPNSTVQIHNTGVLAIAGSTQTIGALSGDSGTKVLLDGGTLAAGGDNASTAYAGVIGDVSDNGSFIKAGMGSLSLSGTNIYKGNTVISAGELVWVTGGSVSNSVVNVSSGATNGVQVTTANGHWVNGGLTFAAGTNYADFNYGSVAPSSTVAPVLVNGNLAFNGTAEVIVHGSAFPASGTIPLIKYTGTLSGTPPTVLVSVPSGITIATLVNDVANSSIDLTFAPYGITFNANSTGAIVTSNAVATLSVSPGATASSAVTITLTSGNTEVTPSTSVTLPIGVTSTNLNFHITGVGSSTVTATSGGLLAATIQVAGALPTINLPPAASAAVGAPASVTLTLIAPYPFTGPYTVTLTSANSAVTANQTVTLGEGVSSINVSFPILASGLSTVTAADSGLLNSASITVGDTASYSLIGIYNQWVGDDYVNGNSWTDRINGIVAPTDGGTVHPVQVSGIFGSHLGVERNPAGGNAGFSIPGGNPPTGFTNYTIAVVVNAQSFEGGGNGGYWADNLIIGYDIGGAGQTDWGISWGGSLDDGFGFVAGAGTATPNTDSLVQSPLLLSQGGTHAVAFQLSGNNVNLYEDGVLAQQNTNVAFHAAHNSNGGGTIPLLSTVDANIGGVFPGAIAEVRIYTNGLINGAILTAYLQNYYTSLPTSPTILPAYLDNTGTNLVIATPTQLGHTYYLLSTTNLVPPIVWITNSTTAGTGGTITNTAPVIPRDPAQFFQYLVQ